MVIFHQFWLMKMFAVLGKVDQKGGFPLIIAIFWVNLSPEDKVIDRGQLISSEPHFSFTFQLSTCFHCNYLAKSYSRAP